ncbi:hypothetical protein [Actinacidiphila acididurans]|uniref:Uncharacterized protein n=1 Tax=Actinacidiphila acididurans TaxID=2784346 RepID=A0ABS2U651_9ACTN|nr:hypothetical protein [Actinacidiphila acididurans]MBM9509975.1 hypothetical protein [Actinacidiphila acididurans]
MPKPTQTRVFVVSTIGSTPDEPRSERIEAAYYQQEGDFTVFKDVAHEPVHSVRNQHLISVTRADGADPVTASLLELAATAREKGRAHGVITWETSNQPGGRVYRAGLDVTMVLTGESASETR